MTDMVMGANASPLYYAYTGRMPLNWFLLNSGWATVTTVENGVATGDIASIPFNADGYPTSVTVNTTTALVCSYNVNSLDPIPSGDYVCKWKGTGTVVTGDQHGFQVGFSNKVTVGNRSTFTFDSNNGNSINFYITATDAADPVHEIVFVQAAYEALYDAGEILHPDWVAQARAYAKGGYRCMDLLNVLNSIEVNWSDRKPLTYYNWTPHDIRQGSNDPFNNYASGIPHEVAIAIAKKLNCAIYVNVPLNATDDYILQMAILYYNALKGLGIPVYVEFYNELWLQFSLGATLWYDSTANGGVGAIVYRGPTGFADTFRASALAASPAIYSLQDGTTLASTSDSASQSHAWTYAIIRSVKMAQIWASVWTGADAVNCRPTMAVWWGNKAGSADIQVGGLQPGRWTGAAGQYFKAYATAPYWDTQKQGFWLPIAWSTDADLGAAKCAKEMQTGGILPTAGDAVTTTGTASAFTATYAPAGTPVHGTMVPVTFHVAPNAGATFTCGGVTAPIKQISGNSLADYTTSGGPVTAVYTTATNEGAITPAYVICNIGGMGGSSSLGSVLAISASHKANCDAYGLENINYEMGMSLLAGGNTVAEAMMEALMRSTAFVTPFYEYLQGLRTAGVVRAFHYFDVGHLSNNYLWGALERMSDYATPSPRYQAIKQFNTHRRISFNVT